MTKYAVNGKEPVAAWIPSLDTAGNGTTTLTDLVGSNDGTLTNMDAATDWVLSDGKYALDLDGSDDFVLLPLSLYSILSSAETTVSLWFAGSSLQSAVRLQPQVASYFVVGWQSTGLRVISQPDGGTSGLTLPATAIDSNWHHVVATRKSGDTFDIYLDGSLAGTRSAGGAFNWSPSIPPAMGRYVPTGGERTTGKIDDVRIFNNKFDATDVAYLYNSGNGRGVTPKPLNVTAPTLTIDATSFSGSVGTWDAQSNGSLSYEWEIRKASDDSVVASGTGSTVSGSGTFSGEYYLWVRASNDGGFDAAEDSTSKAAATYVQHSTAIANVVGSQTVSLTGVAEGSTLILAICEDLTSLRTYTVTDNQANTWSQVIANDANSNRQVNVYVARNVSAGDTTVTVVADSSMRANLTLIEVENASWEAPILVAEFDSTGSPHYCAPATGYDVTKKSFAVSGGTFSADAISVTPNAGCTTLVDEPTDVPRCFVQYCEVANDLTDERFEFETGNVGRQGPMASVAVQGMGQIAAGDPPPSYTPHPLDSRHPLRRIGTIPSGSTAPHPLDYAGN